MLEIQKLDFLVRVIGFIHFNASIRRSVWWLILGSALLQVFSEYLPFVAWFTWPFLVYICAQAVQDEGAGELGRVQYLVLTLRQLKSKGEVLVALALYGALSLIIFRGLMEALSWVRMDWDVLPHSVITLFPFTFAQAFSVLFIANCAYKLNIDDSDPFKILSLSIKELFVSPVSTLIVLLVQSIVWTFCVISISFYFQSPLISTFLGHAPFILFVLIWICGQPIVEQDKSWIESVQ